MNRLFLFCFGCVSILAPPKRILCSAFPATFETNTASIMPGRPSKELRAFFATCRDNHLTRWTQADYEQGHGDTPQTKLNFAVRRTLCSYDNLQAWKRSFHTEREIARQAQAAITEKTLFNLTKLTEWEILQIENNSHEELAKYLTAYNMAFFVDIAGHATLSPQVSGRSLPSNISHVNQVVGYVDTTTHPNRAILKIPRMFLAISKDPRHYTGYQDASLTRVLEDITAPFRDMQIHTHFLFSVDAETYEYKYSVLAVSVPDLHNISVQNVYCYSISTASCPNLYAHYITMPAPGPNLYAHYITMQPNGILAEIVAPKNGLDGRPEKLLMLYNSVTHDDLTSAACIEYPPKFDENGSCVSYTMPDKRGTKPGKFLPSTYFTDLGLFEPFAEATTDPDETLCVVS